MTSAIWLSLQCAVHYSVQSTTVHCNAMGNLVNFNIPLLCRDAKLMIFSLWKPQSVQSGQPGQLLLASAGSKPVYCNSPLLSRDPKFMIFSLWKLQSVPSGQPGQLLLASAVRNTVYFNCPLLCKTHIFSLKTWNLVCSWIQNYSSKWLCGDSSRLVTSFNSDVKLNLLPQSSHWNLVCSLIQNFSSKWLCDDNLSLGGNFKSRIHIEPFSTIPSKEILFTLWFRTTLQNDYVEVL